MDPFRILTFGAKFDSKKFKTNFKRSVAPVDKCENEVSTLNAKRKKVQDPDEIRNEHNIFINGFDVKCPITNFDQLAIEPWLKENLKLGNYLVPTPIQMQTIPLMLDQRDIIGCAPTGSGKTLAFLLPLINQLKAPQNAGFRAIILTPTRELAKQIHRECLWLSNGSELRVHLIKNTNLAEKKFGPNSSLKYDILVTTPKRLEFLINQNPPAINIENLEWLIIDECDRLFELTFRGQLSSIFNICNRSKAKLNHALFSATYDSNLEKWCKLNLDNIVTVIIGGQNKITETVEQKLLFVGTESGKLFALKEIISNGCQTPVIIFVNRIAKAHYLQHELQSMSISVDAIHADRNQEHRDKIVRAFREGKILFLITTELMGRGIDFKAVNLVINYDLPNSSFAYIHHIGRTGRAGRKGTAITFYTQKDEESLCNILNVMKQSGCEIPEHLKDFNRKKAIQFKQLEKQLALKKKKYKRQKKVAITEEENE